MGVVIPVGFGIMRLKWAVVGSVQEMICTIGYDGDVAEVPNTDADEINTIMEATGRPAKPAEYSSGYQWRGVEVTRMTSTGPITGSKLRNVTGTKSALTVPINSALLLQKTTARGGRMGRGRCFLPPIWTAEGNIDQSGVVTSFDLSGIQTLWDSALTALLASDCPPVLLHSDGSTPDPITSWTVNQTLATQRRRMRR